MVARISEIIANITEKRYTLKFFALDFPLAGVTEAKRRIQINVTMKT